MSTIKTKVLTLLTSLLIAPTAFAQDTTPLSEARAAYDQGNWSTALKLYDEIYSGNSASYTARVEAALERSNILWEQGDYSKAKKLAEAALKIAEEQRIDGAVGRLLVTIGHIETSQGQLSRAKKTFKICASISQEGDDAVFAAICRMNLAMIYKMQGKSSGNNQQFQKDIKALKGAKTPLATGSALAKTAELFAETGDPERALSMLEQAQSQFAAAGSIPAQARNRIRIARTLQIMGDYDRARAHLKLGKEALEKMNNRPAMIDVYGLLGKDAQVAGDREAAYGYYKKSLSTAKAIGNPQLTARSHLAICELLINPLTEGVTHHCQKAADGFDKLHINALEARANIALASIAQQNNELKSARKLYTEIIEEMEKLPPSQAVNASIATQKANLCQVNHGLVATGAMKSCEDAIEALTALSNAEDYQLHIASSYYSAAFSAQTEKRLKKALRYFEHAAAGYAKASSPDYMRSADSHLRMGIIYSVLLKGEPNSIDAFKKALNTIEKVPKTSQTNKTKAQIYHQLIQELTAQQKWSEAISHGQHMISFAEPLNYHQELAYTYNNLASAHLKTGDKPTAINDLKKGIEHAKKVSSEKDLLKLMRANLKKLDK